MSKHKPKTRGINNPDYLRGKSVEYRFKYHSSEPNKNGCILWTGAPNNSGYGIMRFGGRNTLAHRVSFLLSNGVIPDGMHVLHKCDTPLCVNPEHLFLGTNSDNVADKVSKGRQARASGENHPSSKLTESLVREIRKDTRSHKVIAKEHGLCRSTVSYIKTQKLWAHIPE